MRSVHTGRLSDLDRENRRLRTAWLVVSTHFIRSTKLIESEKIDADLLHGLEGEDAGDPSLLLFMNLEG